MDFKPFGFVVASLVATSLLCGCGSPKTSTAAAAAATAPGGAGNALLADAGTPRGVPLDAATRAELDSIAAGAPPALRPRLRYALATGDDGRAHLVVYDGEGLPADGHHKGHPHEYVVFRVINSKDDEHYDPQQNAIVAPIAAPKDRDSSLVR